MPLEVLHFALMLLGGSPRMKGAEVAALAGSRIDFPRIEPKLSGRKFPDHR
jgi:hypothetical protein